MSDRAALLARIATLERESRQAFDDAQREADALFAQYQLSQLVASGGTLENLGRSVVHETVRLAAVDHGAIWIGRPDGGDLVLLAAVGDDGAAASGPPATVAGLEDGHRWCAGIPGGRAVTLSDQAPTILLGLWASDGRTPDQDGVRVTQLARHELAVAFRGARLRETLERERGELTAVVDGTADLIIQVDGERRVVRLNPAGERLLGLSAADALGRTCEDVLGCDVAGGHIPAACPLAEVIESGLPVPYRETAIRGGDGVPVTVAGGYSAVAADIPASGARPTGSARATGILRDIGAARALEQLREGFVATVSHELRTPLSLIRGYAETLLHLDLEPAEQRIYIEKIDEVTGRLSSLVGQILDITHLQADPLILERVPVLFASLVTRLRGDLAGTDRADRLVVNLPDDLPAIEVDGARVGQILENVVGNAFKYGPPGGVVTISARVVGDRFVVAVDDEGVGIPTGERPLVTEPFHRAWNVRESRIPGTGLGLFISRRLVEAHGGHLGLEDRPDGRPGTRVTFDLPVMRGHRASSKPVQRAEVRGG